MLKDFARLRNVFQVIVGLALLWCKVNAQNACNQDQITWKSKGNYRCLECRECPEGFQPSVRCGSTVKYRTSVRCVQCDLGRTYSNSNGTFQCRKCKVCPEGKAVKKNCTLVANTVCDNKCINGYYLEPIVSTCLRCAECCGDEYDEKATDCASGENKCKIRYTSKPCKKKERGTEATNGKKSPSTVLFHDGTTSQTTTEELKETTTTVRPTTQGDGVTPFSGDKMEHKEKDNKNLLYIVWSLIAALILLAVLAVFVEIRRRRESIDRIPDIEESSQSLATETNSGFLTLEQLEQRHLEQFDTMCLRLDNRRRSFRWDYVSLAAKYQKISLDERDSLHGERQRKGGSPSRELMSYIKARYPNHSVVELTKNLKGIGRDDIAEMLEPLIKNTA